MLEYPVAEAIDVVNKSVASAQSALASIEDDLSYLREQVSARAPVPAVRPSTGRGL